MRRSLLGMLLLASAGAGCFFVTPPPDDGDGSGEGEGETALLGQVARTQPLESTAECPAGGVQVDTGIDDNGNGTLDQDEVDQSLIVCNGTPGTNGANGTNGTNGADGADGTNGADGVKALVATSTDVPTSDCAAGGLRVTTGLDVDGDGVLDADEVTRTDTVCNGVAGAPGAPTLVVLAPATADDGCANGGTKITSGVDDNRDGSLATDEIDQRGVVCNGRDGAPGAPGTPGAPGPQGPPGNNGPSLVDIIPLQPGEGGCPFGGSVVRAGIDGNGNGRLDETTTPSEVTSRQTLCSATAPPEETIIIGTQTELRALSSRVGIFGSLYIAGDDPVDPVTSLAPLANLRSVSGDFFIFDAALSSFAGLENLERVGFASFFDNPNLADVSALDGATFGILQFVRTALTRLPRATTANLDVSEDPQLRDLSGLSPLTTLDTLGLADLPQFASFSGAEALTSINSAFFLNLPLPTSFAGLGLSGTTTRTAIETVRIAGCPGLVTTTAIDGLVSRADVIDLIVPNVDALEPNNTPATAAPADDARGELLSVSSLDEDWFRFSVASPSTLTINPFGSPDAGDEPRFEVFAIDANNVLTAFGGTGLFDRPQAVFAQRMQFALPAGNYVVRATKENDPGVFPDEDDFFYALDLSLDDVGGGVVTARMSRENIIPLALDPRTGLRRGDRLVVGQLLIGLQPMTTDAMKKAVVDAGLVFVRFAAPQIAVAALDVQAAKARVPGVIGTQATAATEAKLVELRHARPAAFRYVEANQLQELMRTPNDTLFPDQWHYEQIGLPAAWDTTIGDSNTTIAVLDSGLVPNHPDLGCGRLTLGFDFLGTEFPRARVQPFDEDPAGSHGTHVLGTIGACTDDVGGARGGVAGVNWISPVQMVRVCSTDGCPTDAIISGIAWAGGVPLFGGVCGIDFDGEDDCDNPTPAKVLNMSLGGFGRSQAQQDAINEVRARGAIVVAAAGNENAPAELFSPANLDGVVTVGAVGPTGNRASYSNFGGAIDIMAPGGQGFGIDGLAQNERTGVLSTSGGTEVGPTFAWISGTSMAAPHIAGVISLLLTVKPTLNAEQAISILARSANPIASCGADICGPGLVDVPEALALAAQPTPAIGVVPVRVSAGTNNSVQFLVQNFGESSGTVTVTPATEELTVTTPTQPIAARAPDGFAPANVPVDINIVRTGLAPGRYTARLDVVVTDQANPTIRTVSTVIVAFDVRDANGLIPLAAPARASLVRIASNRQNVRAVDVGVTRPFESFSANDGRVEFSGVRQGQYIVVGEADLDSDGAVDVIGCAPGGFANGCARAVVDLFGDVTLPDGPLNIDLVPF